MSGVVVLNANPPAIERGDPLVHLEHALLSGTAEPLVDAFVACAECADHRWLTAPGSVLRDRAIAMVVAAIPSEGLARAQAVAEVTVRLAIGYAVSPPHDEDARAYAQRVLLPVTGGAR